MKAINLIFQIHQPFMFRRYRFFEIGNEHYYYDDYANETQLRKFAFSSYLPANALLLRLINEYKGKIKVSFYISGSALNLFELYQPDVIESFRELANTNCVEFITGTYSHSLSSLKTNSVFEEEALRHQTAIRELFNQTSVTFMNTEMIYSDEIGERIAKMGFKAAITEGARHILGWKSPNFLYCNVLNPRLKLLMRHYKLSDDLTFNFSNTNWSEYPLTPDKFLNWIESIDDKSEVINLCVDYETFGGIQPKETGIFNFLAQFLRQAANSPHLTFSTPSAIADQLQPVSMLAVPKPVSWADDERDLAAWAGNDLQTEALTKLYELEPKMAQCSDPELRKDWDNLQMSDHFFYMSTKHSGVKLNHRLNPYNSPHEAFINYMNILSDFSIRVNDQIADNPTDPNIALLKRQLEEKDAKIKHFEEEIKLLRKLKNAPLKS